MSYVAGIDYSTRSIDVILLDEDTDRATWQPFPLHGPGDAFDRARTVREALPPRSWWEDAGIIAIGIEDPRGYAAGHLYRVQGAILACIPTALLVHPWIPSSWRTAVNLAGNSSKQAVKIHSLRLAGTSRETDRWPQDAHDAHLIARATRSVLQYPEAA